MFLRKDPLTLSHSRDLIVEMDSIINDFKPDVIFTNWPHDTHQEHTIVSKAVQSAARRNIHSLYFFEPIIPCGITDKKFIPTTYIDVSYFIKQKLDCVRAYKNECRKYPGWIDAIEGRAKFNGFKIGVKYAETFQAVKDLTYLP